MSTPAVSRPAVHSSAAKRLRTIAWAVVLLAIPFLSHAQSTSLAQDAERLERERQIEAKTAQLRTLHTQGRYEEVIATANELLQIDPQNQSAKLWLERANEKLTGGPPRPTPLVPIRVNPTAAPVVTPRPTVAPPTTGVGTTEVTPDQTTLPTTGALPPSQRSSSHSKSWMPIILIGVGVVALLLIGVAIFFVVRMAASRKRSKVAAAEADEQPTMHDLHDEVTQITGNQRGATADEDSVMQFGEVGANRDASPAPAYQPRAAAAALPITHIDDEEPDGTPADRADVQEAVPPTVQDEPIPHVDSSSKSSVAVALDGLNLNFDEPPPAPEWAHNKAPEKKERALPGQSVAPKPPPPPSAAPAPRAAAPAPAPEWAHNKPPEKKERALPGQAPAASSAAPKPAAPPPPMPAKSSDEISLPGLVQEEEPGREFLGPPPEEQSFGALMFAGPEETKQSSASPPPPPGSTDESPLSFTSLMFGDSNETKSPVQAGKAPAQKPEEMSYASLMFSGGDETRVDAGKTPAGPPPEGETFNSLMFAGKDETQLPEARTVLDMNAAQKTKVDLGGKKSTPAANDMTATAAIPPPGGKGLAQALDETIRLDAGVDPHASSDGIRLSNMDTPDDDGTVLMDPTKKPK